MAAAGETKERWKYLSLLLPWAARSWAALDDSENTLFTVVLFSFRFSSSSLPHTLILGSLVSEKYLVCLKEKLVLLVV